jgi:hypothetical protein
MRFCSLFKEAFLEDTSVINLFRGFSVDKGLNEAEEAFIACESSGDFRQ